MPMTVPTTVMDDDGEIAIHLTLGEANLLWELIQSDAENLSAGGYSFLGAAWEYERSEKLRTTRRKLSVIKPSHGEVDGVEFIRSGW